MRRSASCSSSSRAAPAPRSWGSRYVTQGCLPEQPPRRGQRQGGRGGSTRPGRPHALFSGRGGAASWRQARCFSPYLRLCAPVSRPDPCVGRSPFAPAPAACVFHGGSLRRPGLGAGRSLPDRRGRLVSVSPSICVSGYAYCRTSKTRAGACLAGCLGSVTCERECGSRLSTKTVPVITSDHQRRSGISQPDVLATKRAEDSRWPPREL